LYDYTARVDADPVGAAVVGAVPVTVTVALLPPGHSSSYSSPGSDIVAPT
jgi:hypothetical protein